MLLSENNCFVKTAGSFFQILRPSYNVSTFPLVQSETPQIYAKFKKRPNIVTRGGQSISKSLKM